VLSFTHWPASPHCPLNRRSGELHSRSRWSAASASESQALDKFYLLYQIICTAMTLLSARRSFQGTGRPTWSKHCSILLYLSRRYLVNIGSRKTWKFLQLGVSCIGIFANRLSVVARQGKGYS
jgi:hypothetical protein